MLVSIYSSVPWVDTLLLNQIRRTIKAADAAFLDFMHLQKLLGIFLQWTREEKIRALHLHARYSRAIRVRRNFIPNMVSDHTPTFRIAQGYCVSVLTADCGGVFPQSTGDLGCQTLLVGEGSPPRCKDCDMVPSIKKDPGRDETSDTSAYDQDGWRCSGRGLLW